MSNVMKRALALLLVLIMLASMVACGDESTPTPDPDSGDTTTTPADDDTPADDQNEDNNGGNQGGTNQGGGDENNNQENQLPPEPVAEDFTIVENGAAKYVIVSRKNAYDSLAESLATQLTAKTGTLFLAKDKKGTGEKAIFIGYEPKNLMTTDLERLTYSGYVFRQLNNDIHLTGYSSESIEAGIERMLEVITDDCFEFGAGGALKTVTLPGSLLKTHNPTYAKRDATLLGRKISEYEIVVPKNYTIVERVAVEAIIDAIGRSTGYKIDYRKENAKAKKSYFIVYGVMDTTAFPYGATLDETLTPNSYRIKNNGNDLYIAYSNSLVGTETAAAMDALCVKNSSATVDTTKSFDYSAYRVDKNEALISENNLDANKVVRIMTSNIVAPGDANGQKDIEEKYNVTWQERMQIQGDMIMTYRPDFIGFQELQEGTTEGVYALAQTEILKTIGSEYEMIYFDGVSKQGYFTPIAYRFDKWRVVDKDVGGSLSTNNMHRWQWAYFQMLDDPTTTEDESEIEYIVMNLHYPISSMEDARQIAGQQVHDEFVRLKELYPDVPISIVGDFNASFGSELFNLTIGADEMGIADTDLKPSYMATADKGDSGTADIDHVLIENDDTTVLNYRRVTTGLLQWTSDHRPVFADIYIGKADIPTPGPELPWGDGVNPNA